MHSDLYKNIANSTAHKASRYRNAQYIWANAHLFGDLLALAWNTQDKNHHKACWIMELVLEKELFLLAEHLDVFCEGLSSFSNESALRSVSKICLFVSQHLSLTALQQELITENALDWLIAENRKVATKAYAIRTLFALGKSQDWIYPQLYRILTEDYPKHSAGYKAVAREILKKIK
ncbi:hypothetical protein [Flavobacterium crassostreae]|uniref:Adenylosuccinate lyase n=1 Tax=Flavobacterium crassostreae TaxID=1763534 RepID=A0A1B9E3V4_9FLAO|nr:hypothetical protein [Flavobacterium crassostreae]OCB76634.1 hypothetical protein LPBF_06795 [Flavobacterium crassostreae]